MVDSGTVFAPYIKTSCVQTRPPRQPSFLTLASSVLISCNFSRSSSARHYTKMCLLRMKKHQSIIPQRIQPAETLHTMCLMCDDPYARLPDPCIGLCPSPTQHPQRSLGRSNNERNQCSAFACIRRERLWQACTLSRICSAPLYNHSHPIPRARLHATIATKAGSAVRERLSCMHVSSRLGASCVCGIGASC